MLCPICGPVAVVGEARLDGGAYALATDEGRSGGWNPCGGPARGDVTRGGGAGPFGGGGTGGVDLCLAPYGGATGGGGPPAGVGGCPKGEATGGGAVAGVPRRDCGFLANSSGVSFQFVITFA